MRQLVMSMASESGRSPHQILTEWTSEELIELVAFRNLQSEHANKEPNAPESEPEEMTGADSFRQFLTGSGIGIKRGDTN